MFVALKDKKIIAISDLEWECRKEAKGLNSEKYWTWLESVTSVSGAGPDEVKTYDFSGEDYEIHECEGNFESWFATGLIVAQGADVTLYHLKWDGSKVVKDDDALATYQTAEKWKRIRSQRDALLSDTDWVVVKAKETGGNVSASWKKYRQDLRDVPTQSDPDKITWPTKPS